MSKKILIIGASRGIGFGLVREYLSQGFKVIATERSTNSNTKLKNLASEYKNNLQVEHLEMNDYSEIKKLRHKLANEKIDILFVNAGVCDEKRLPIGEISTEEYNRVMQTNSLSPMRVIETYHDLLKNDGTIVVMSSSLGSISNCDGGYELYRASKAALNMFLKSYSVRARDKSLIAMMPGWVKTDMGGEQAPLEVETSVKGIFKTVEFYQGKAGVRFVNYLNESINW